MWSEASRRFVREGGHSIGMFWNIDWVLFGAALSIALLGLVTMRSFAGEADSFFERQAIWIAISCAAFLLASMPEYGLLRRRGVVIALYVAVATSLLLVTFFGPEVKGAQSRFDIGFFSVQPLDPAKLVLIIVLAKYFAKRHVEIGHIRHIFVSGAYAGLFAALVFLQPDLGGVITLGSIWLGMVLVAGISWRHLAALVIAGGLCAGALWQFALADYQKARILTFIHPLADVRGAGYNAYQATVAVGSGEWIGRGIGEGSQSKLRFLPEYQTDFIVAAFAEEWGFVGVALMFGLYGIVMARTLRLASHGTDNFVTLFGAGLCVMLVSNFTVHVGMNFGLLPVTGTTVPFMSYGGSHLLVEFLGIGMLMGMTRRGRVSVSAREHQTLVLG